MHDEPAKQQKGGGLMWILASLGMLTAAVTSLEFFVAPQYRDPFAAWFFAAGLAVALTSLGVQARRELYPVVLYTMFTAAIVAIFTGGVVVLGRQWHPVAAMICVAATSIALAGFAYVTRRDQRRAIGHRVSLVEWQR